MKGFKEIGAPLLGGLLSVSPPFSQLSTPHSPLGQFRFKDPAALSLPPALPTTTVFSFSLSPLFFFFFFFNMQVAMKNFVNEIFAQKSALG